MNYDFNPIVETRFVVKIKWRPLSLSELTPMIFNTGLTHLGSEASKSNSVFVKVFSFFFRIKIYIETSDKIFIFIYSDCIIDTILYLEWYRGYKTYNPISSNIS